LSLCGAELLREEPEDPRADDPHFRVLLGPAASLPHAIHSARWKRSASVFTTGDRLLSAQDVTELTMAAGAERDRIWRMLHERPM
jgi:hypothetical protein